jgi:glycine dehydrogenase subunit 2
MLGEITGLPAVSVGLLAGAQGEFAGLLIGRAFHEDRGEGEQRNVALIPDSAHGTNPASAAMAGLEVVTVPSDEHGNISMEDLRRLADERTAVFMLTIPNTVGLFEPDIHEITEIIHDVGGLVYADGANLNALLGLAKLGDLGFDIAHSNLHKTYSTPHGGGGPGSGPVLVIDELAKYLPTPVVGEKNGKFALVSPERTIGRLNGFQGRFGIAVRAYTYIRLMGLDGIKAISRNAIINANYIQSQLKDDFDIAYDRYCMHETVMSALDVAKRLIDYGIHPPTMYFPLIVPEALMIEPTETESKETLDAFIAVMKTIAAEAQESPELLHEAPHNAANTRLDEAAD